MTQASPTDVGKASTCVYGSVNGPFKESVDLHRNASERGVAR